MAIGWYLDSWLWSRDLDRRCAREPIALTLVASAVDARMAGTFMRRGLRRVDAVSAGLCVSRSGSRRRMDDLRDSPLAYGEVRKSTQRD
jgi:hypothetical protein